MAARILPDEEFFFFSFLSHLPPRNSLLFSPRLFTLQPSLPVNFVFYSDIYEHESTLFFSTMIREVHAYLCLMLYVPLR